MRVRVQESRRSRSLMARFVQKVLATFLLVLVTVTVVVVSVFYVVLLESSPFKSFKFPNKKIEKKNN